MHWCLQLDHIFCLCLMMRFNMGWVWGGTTIATGFHCGWATRNGRRYHPAWTNGWTPSRWNLPCVKLSYPAIEHSWPCRTVQLVEHWCLGMPVISVCGRCLPVLFHWPVYNHQPCRLASQLQFTLGHACHRMNLHFSFHIYFGRQVCKVLVLTSGLSENAKRSWNPPPQFWKIRAPSSCYQG